MLERSRPLYQMIYQQLRKRMDRGELRPGDVLPAEKDLQATFRVSRAPVRQALAKLEAEDRIARHPGRLTRVTHPADAGKWQVLSGFGHHYVTDWNRLSVKTLEVQRLPAPREVARDLKVTEGDALTYVRRLRKVDDRPVLLMEHWLPSDFTPDIIRQAGDFFSIQAILRERFGVTVETAHETLVATELDEKPAVLLDLPVGRAVLHITRTCFDQRGRPVDNTRYWVCTDLWQYRTRFRHNWR